MSIENEIEQNRARDPGTQSAKIPSARDHEIGMARRQHQRAHNLLDRMRAREGGNSRSKSVNRQGRLIATDEVLKLRRDMAEAILDLERLGAAL